MDTNTRIKRAGNAQIFPSCVRHAWEIILMSVWYVSLLSSIVFFIQTNIKLFTIVQTKDQFGKECKVCIYLIMTIIHSLMHTHLYYNCNSNNLNNY